MLGMIGVTLLFCDNFSAVNRRLALLAASFNLAGLVVEALRLQPQGTNIAIVFDGFFCILIGCLIFRSTFTTRILGTLMAIRRFGLADLFVTAARKLPGSLQSGARPPRSKQRCACGSFLWA